MTPDEYAAQVEAGRRLSRERLAAKLTPPHPDDDQ